MSIIYLSLYGSFECIASECQNSCCIGWRIKVDDESFERFKNLDNAELRDDILNNIIENDKGRQFRLLDQKRCSMLDGDNLCRIQRNTNEETLCVTCRKFPRVIYALNDEFKAMHKEYSEVSNVLSMSASCPVVASYLLNLKTEYIMSGDNEDASVYDMKHDGNLCKASKAYKSAEIIINNDIAGFEGKYRQGLRNFCQNYFIYRYFNLVFETEYRDTRIDFYMNKDTYDISLKNDNSEGDVIAKKVLNEELYMIKEFKDVYTNTGSLSQNEIVGIICTSYRKFAH